MDWRAAPGRLGGDPGWAWPPPRRPGRKGCGRVHGAKPPHWDGFASHRPVTGPARRGSGHEVHGPATLPPRSTGFRPGSVTKVRDPCGFLHGSGGGVRPLHPYTAERTNAPPGVLRRRDGIVEFVDSHARGGDVPGVFVTEAPRISSFVTISPRRSPEPSAVPSTSAISAAATPSRGRRRDGRRPFRSLPSAPRIAPVTNPRYPASSTTGPGQASNLFSLLMCGIVGYVGKRPCEELLLQGLEKLEYRGYDSAGISLLDGGEVESVHAVGNLANLRAAVERVAAGNGDGSSRPRPRPASPTPAGPPTAGSPRRTPTRTTTARARSTSSSTGSSRTTPSCASG